MPLQYSVAVRNAKLDAVETTIGVSPTMEIRSGAAPATCATAASGTVLATLALPADWMSAAAAGVKAMLGSWADNAADAGGVAGHFRINAGATCHMQGSVTATGGGGDLTVDNTTFAINQAFSVTSFSLTAGNA